MKDLFYDLQEFISNYEKTDDADINTLYRYAVNDARHPLHGVATLCDAAAESRGLAPFDYFLSVWRRTEEELSEFIDD